MTDQPPLIGPDRDVQTVVADPPWMESGAGESKRGADRGALGEAGVQLRDDRAG